MLTAAKPRTGLAVEPEARVAVLRTAVLLTVNALLFALQVHINALAVASQHEPAAKVEFAPGGGLLSLSDLLRLPYPAVDQWMRPVEHFHLALIALAIVQAAVLLALYNDLRRQLDRPIVRALVGVTAVVMFGLALRATTLSSLDMYAYIGYAKLGFAHAFAPTSAPFPGPFAVINHLWGRPIVACYYGPLWLAVEQLVVGPIPTLGGAILATRAIGLVALIACVIALYRCNLPRAAVVLVAINPAILNLYVVNGHNDVVGVAFALAGLSVAARMPIVAAILVGCAGLAKIPLTALSLAIFAGTRPLAYRIGYVALAVVIALAGADLAAGPVYLRDLLTYADQVGAHNLDASIILGRILALLGLAALVIAFFRGTVFRAGTWPIFMLSGVIFNWYLAWCMPYAARAGATFLQLLIGYPIVAALLVREYPNLHYRQYTMAALIVYALYDFMRYRTTAIPVLGSDAPAPARAPLPVAAGTG